MLVLLFVGTASANESDSINELQDQFRKLGGTIAPLEDNLGVQYLFLGWILRGTQSPFDVARVLRSLREAHLAAVPDGKPSLWHFNSALMANRAGRNLLELERDHTSLLDVTARRRVNSELRDFHDAEIDMGWTYSHVYSHELVDPELVDLEFADLAFRSAELSRARDFMRSAVQRVNLGGRPSEELAFSQFEALLAYKEADEALRSYQVMSEWDKAFLPVIRRSIESRMAAIDSRGLARFDKPYAVDPGVLSASDIANQTGIGEVLIEYHVTQRSAYAFVIIRNAPPRFIRLPGSTAELREHARTFHAQLSSGLTERGSFVAPRSNKESWRDTGYKLYETLIQPIEPYFHQADRLIIAPHDLINLVSFAALPTSKNGEETFLLDRYSSILVVPTLMFRHFDSSRRREPTRLAMVIGINDFTLTERLNFAEEEARNISAKLNGSDLLLGSREEANYPSVASQIERYAIIHIASHGRYVSMVPELSHVLLRRQDGQGDEPLMSVDVLGTRLNASLVVLSACETATPDETGLPRNGDILGLPRSFLMAGANAVIASLWNVNDLSTSNLFEYLYSTAFTDSLTSGIVVLPNVPLDIALARAQRQIRREFPNPHYWAPFVLFGNNR